MMPYLNNLSIKQRLTLIIMSISGISVFLTTIAILVIGVYNTRNNIVDELDGLASIAGKSNIGAVSFDEYKNVKDNLNSFSGKQSIVQVCLYDYKSIIGEEINLEVGHYVNNYVKTIKECPRDFSELTIISSDNIKLMRSIRKDDDIVGFLYIESTLDDVKRYIIKQIFIALSIGIAGLFLSYFLAVSLQKAISNPILVLTETARKVSLHKDYTIRAKLKGNINQSANNELVILTESFNEMLSEIDARNVQLRKQYSELEKARDDAESANRAKSHFLANISHELRTPLNAIIGFSSILMNQLFGPLGDEKYLEYAKDINESGTHLLEIINDILDLSKAEAGKLILSYEEVHVGKAINKCVTIITDRANKGKVTISVDVPRMLPALLIDRLRFIQVILNVISNAVKFTPEGGNVHISVKNQQNDFETSEFIISIKDTGIGMSKDDIESAFQRFGQVDSGLNRKYEGTGLGLPLTKKLMELHHGKIEIESEIGKGTNVVLYFPEVPPIDITKNL